MRNFLSSKMCSTTRSLLYVQVQSLRFYFQCNAWSQLQTPLRFNLLRCVAAGNASNCRIRLTVPLDHNGMSIENRMATVIATFVSRLSSFTLACTLTHWYISSLSRLLIDSLAATTLKRQLKLHIVALSLISTKKNKQCILLRRTDKWTWTLFESTKCD